MIDQERICINRANNRCARNKTHEMEKRSTAVRRRASLFYGGCAQRKNDWWRHARRAHRRSNQFYPKLGNFLSLFRSPSWKQNARCRNRSISVFLDVENAARLLVGVAVEWKIDRLILGNRRIWWRLLWFRDFNLCGYFGGFCSEHADNEIAGR